MSRFGFAYVIAWRQPRNLYTYRIGAQGEWLPCLQAGGVSYERLRGSGDSGIVVHPSRRLLYVIDQDEDRIVPFQIGGDGALSVTDPVFVKAGFGLRSGVFDATGRFLYIIGAGSFKSSKPPSLLSFRLSRSGVPIPLKPPEIIVGKIPESVITHPHKPFLYLTDRENRIYPFRIGSNGTLTLLNPSPLRTEIPAGTMLVAPSGRFAYVFNGNWSGTDRWFAEQFRVGEDGRLKPLQPFHLAAERPPTEISDWHPAGRSVYVTIDSVTRLYRIAPSGGLQYIKPASAIKKDGQQFGPLKFDRTGRYAYFLTLEEDDSTVVHAFVVQQDGALIPNPRFSRLRIADTGGAILQTV